MVVLGCGLDRVGCELLLSWVVSCVLACFVVCVVLLFVGETKARKNVLKKAVAGLFAVGFVVVCCVFRDGATNIYIRSKTTN